MPATVIAQNPQPQDDTTSTEIRYKRFTVLVQLNLETGYFETFVIHQGDSSFITTSTSTTIVEALQFGTDWVDLGAFEVHKGWHYRAVNMEGFWTAEAFNATETMFTRFYDSDVCSDGQEKALRDILTLIDQCED